MFTMTIYNLITEKKVEDKLKSHIRGDSLYIDSMRFVMEQQYQEKLSEEISKINKQKKYNKKVK